MCLIFEVYFDIYHPKVCLEHKYLIYIYILHMYLYIINYNRPSKSPLLTLCQQKNEAEFFMCPRALKL